MQPKTIKSILRKKLQSWCDSIPDKNLVRLINRDTICTGGAIVSLLQNENPNDFDFYFKTKETALAVAEYYVALFKKQQLEKKKSFDKEIYVASLENRVKIVVKSSGVAKDVDIFEQDPSGVTDPSEPLEFEEGQLDEDEKDTSAKEKLSEKYAPVFLTTNAISLSDKVQLVVRFFGEVEEIHKNYDFVHCTCSWEASTGDLVLPPEALVAIINKRLIYKRSRYPLCSIIRTRKFLQRGWKIDAGQYVKMAWDLHKLDLSQVSVLEDQLIGVDSAYFNCVISQLQSDAESKSQDEMTYRVDEAYLMEVINTVFN